MRKSLIALTLIIGIAVVPPGLRAQNTDTPVYTYRVIHSYPHDSFAFTQGLVYDKGFLYEGTGMWGFSSIRKVELETGKILQIHELDRCYFGEGITIWENTIPQLTYLSQFGFVYDLDTFEEIKRFAYPMKEGWGLTHNGQNLIMSDGTDKLYFLNPQTFEILGHLSVHDQGEPVDQLNELEYINGKIGDLEVNNEIFANLWLSDCIARISPKEGRILAWIDLSGLGPQWLNGIAYDKTGERLFVTGKAWPNLFQIELVPTQEKVNCVVPKLTKTKND